MQEYSALLDDHEQHCKLDCGCKMKRCFGNAVAITFCKLHDLALSTRTEKFKLLRRVQRLERCLSDLESQLSVQIRIDCSMGYDDPENDTHKFLIQLRNRINRTLTPATVKPVTPNV